MWLGRLRMDLIEPYWNVKSVALNQENIKLIDLIEPYWNVKKKHGLQNK